MQTRMKSLALVALAALAASGWAGPAQAGGKKAPVNGVVNVNTASREDLMRLPGIGKAKADAILAYRQQQPFAAAQDLLKVNGIGPAILNQIQSHVSTEGPTTLQPGAAGTKTSGASPTTPPAGDQG